MNEDAYSIAQRAIADLKSAVRQILRDGPAEGMRNADVGRTLGIYFGYDSGNVGHIPRTLLGVMETEGTVQFNPETQRWTLTQS